MPMTATKTPILLTQLPPIKASHSSLVRCAGAATGWNIGRNASGNGGAGAGGGGAGAGRVSDGGGGIGAGGSTGGGGGAGRGGRRSGGRRRGRGWGFRGGGGHRRRELYGRLWRRRPSGDGGDMPRFEHRDPT